MTNPRPRLLAASVLSVSLLAFLSLSTTGCGGAGADGDHGTLPDVAPPMAPLTADALLPSDALFVARIDIGALRASANWDVVEGWILTAEENLVDVLPSLGDGELRRWLALTDRVWVAMVPSDDFRHPGFVTVVEGRFEAAAIDQKLASLGGERPILMRIPEQPQRFRGSWWFEEVAVLEDGLVVASSRGLEGPVRSRHQSGDGESPLSQDLLRDMSVRVDLEHSAVAAVVRFTPEAKAALGAGVDDERRRMVDAATAGGFRLSLAEGLDAMVLLDTTSPEVATALVSEVEGRRDEVRRNPFVGMMGLAPLLDGIRAAATGGNAQVTLRTGVEDTRAVLGRVSNFVGLAIAAGISDLPRPEAAVEASQSREVRQ